MVVVGSAVPLWLLGCMGVLGSPGRCVAGERRCAGEDVVSCGADGSWTAVETCRDGCRDGACLAPTCTPDCAGLECGDDGCGGSCGDCTGPLDECLAGACTCRPSCDNRVCGDDGCGGSCGPCSGAQEACVDGACSCQPFCDGRNCGDDGCSGSCGTCDPISAFCAADQTCHDCESAVCGVCDEIDVSQVVSYSGSIGGDHANPFLRAEVFDFPITTELDVDLNGSSPCFYLDHFDGQSWNTTSNGYTEGAAMVACWYSHAAGGITCMTFEWYSPDWNVCRTMDWPVGQPVAHMLVSAIDEKRTAIRYFATWPFNDPAHFPDWFNPADVGPMAERSCQ